MIAALSAWHEHHDAASRALREVRALPAHVMIESYSVLTRLPAGLAVPAAAAADALLRRFDLAPLRMEAAARKRLPHTLAGAGIFGGSSYDALVALEATAHKETLLTLDERAQVTYRRLGAAYRVIA